MKKTVSKKQGTLITNGVVLEKHEMMTVVFLLTLGYGIELIRPSTVPGRSMPDFWMCGMQWEMKSPRRGSHSTIEHAYQTAAKQSENIIFDLRRIPSGQETSAINTLTHRFTNSKRVRRMLIINKRGELLQYG